MRDYNIIRILHEYITVMYFTCHRIMCEVTYVITLQLITILVFGYGYEHVKPTSFYFVKHYDLS